MAVSFANDCSRLVLETLIPLPGDRKCFRMINGVLVERTVSDVLPALQTNADGLKKVLEDLVKQYRTKQDEMDKWKVRPTSDEPCNFSGTVTDSKIAEEEQCPGRAAIKARTSAVASSGGWPSQEGMTSYTRIPWHQCNMRLPTALYPSDDLGSCNSTPQKYGRHY